MFLSQIQICKCKYIVYICFCIQICKQIYFVSSSIQICRTVCQRPKQLVRHAWKRKKVSLLNPLYLTNRDFSQLRICKPTPPPLPQFCSHFNERCRMCWIEWKFYFQIFPILIFRVIVKIHWKLGRWRHKNEHSLIFLSIQPIADFSNKFEEKKLFILMHV